MRSILIAATASLCLLAGCNKGAGNNSANAANAAATANTAAPAANAAGAAPAGRRDNEIRECSADMGRRLSSGADVAAFCGCAVDRIAAGASQNDAVNQCATEQHVTVQTGEAPAAGAAEENSAE